jgi:hypothetical protein
MVGVLVWCIHWLHVLVDILHERVFFLPEAPDTQEKKESPIGESMPEREAGEDIPENDR